MCGWEGACRGGPGWELNPQRPDAAGLARATQQVVIAVMTLLMHVWGAEHGSGLVEPCGALLLHMSGEEKVPPPPLGMLATQTWSPPAGMFATQAC